MPQLEWKSTDTTDQASGNGFDYEIRDIEGDHNYAFIMRFDSGFIDGIGHRKSLIRLAEDHHVHIEKRIKEAYDEGFSDGHHEGTGGSI